MPAIYFAASFAGVPLLVSELETERGRDIVVQSPAQGDKHTLSNQGRRLRTVRAEILFVDQPGLAPYTDRYDEFVKLFEDGDPHVLSHPLDGQYTARGGTLTVSASSSSLSIRVSAEFLHEQEEPAVFPVDAGINPAAGLESVTTATDRAISVLDEFELESSAPTAALEEVTSWAEAENLDSQQVFLGVASVTDQIDAAISELGAKSDLSLWPVYRELILLRYEVTRAAAAFTVAESSVFELYIESPRPLLAICAEVYGGADARAKRDQVQRANRLRTPGLVPAGTTLKMPRA